MKWFPDGSELGERKSIEGMHLLTAFPQRDLTPKPFDDNCGKQFKETLTEVRNKWAGDEQV